MAYRRRRNGLSKYRRIVRRNPGFFGLRRTKAARGRAVYKKRRAPGRRYKRLSGPAGFPKKVGTALSYFVVQLPTTDVAGLRGSHKMRLTSIYDPDETGIGHQPYGHDQFEALYTHYRVSKVDVNMMIQPLADAASTNEDMWVIVWTGIYDHYTQFVNMAGVPMLERRDGHLRRFFFGKDEVKDPAHKARRVKFSVNIRREKGKIYNDEEAWTPMGSNPVAAQAWICAVWIIEGNGLAGQFGNPQYAEVRTKLVYHCDFKDPIAVGQS